MVLRRVKDRLRKFNVAVAEVDHQDLWQRAGLGVVTDQHGQRARRTANWPPSSTEIERVEPGLITRTEVEFLDLIPPCQRRAPRSWSSTSVPTASASRFARRSAMLLAARGARPGHRVRHDDARAGHRRPAAARVFYTDARATRRRAGTRPGRSTAPRRSCGARSASASGCGACRSFEFVFDESIERQDRVEQLLERDPTAPGRRGRRTAGHRRR